MIAVEMIKCSSCGHTEKTSDSWLKCPECGHTLCNNCGTKENEKKEKQDLEKLRQGGAYERITTFCPSGGYGMINL